MNVSNLKPSDITVKNVKQFRGREWDGFEATVYIKGKKSLFAWDDGQGGGCNYDFAPNQDKCAYKFVEEINEVFDKIKVEDSTYNITYNLDIAVEKAVQKVENKKILKRLLRGAILVIQNDKIIQGKVRNMKNYDIKGLVNSQSWIKKSDVVLNLLSFDDALEYFEAYA